jgi:signal transduction histidine kinase
MTNNDTEYTDLKSSYNLAIVGGGSLCKTFLDLIQQVSPDYINIRVSCVCDIDTSAEGFVMAENMGIHTTRSYSDIFEIKGIDIILELTGNKVLAELMQQKPAGVAVIEQNAYKLFEAFLIKSRKLLSAQKQIDIEERSYDILFKQSNVGILVLNPDFSIVDANSACLRAVERTREEVVGKTCHEIVKGFYTPCSFPQTGFECPVIQTLRTGKSSMVIHEYTASDGRTSYFNIMAYPIKDKHGNVVRIIELWKEITEQISSKWENRVRRMEMDMKKLVQEDRMISLGRLVASCVHEINNPIQGLLTFSHLMQKILEEGNPSKQDLEDFKKFTNIMSGELERCGEIISGLLSFSRESSIEYKRFEINEIINSVISLTRHKMELSNIRLSINLFQGPINVTGDKNQLQQCFLNLIFNAIESMPSGGELHIISDIKGKNYSTIEITDTGCGIKKDDLDHIFDPFFTTKEEGKGVGLGLSIVYGIVKNHKGDIKVKSDAGKGTTFVMTFPVC